ncbi:MAG: metallophosphoesterase family protein [Pseudomonadota bacterium]
MAFLSRIFYKQSAFDAPLRPNTAFIVVGDIHGHAQSLDDLLSAIDACSDVPSQLVFVGDYIDRGDGSAAVLRKLYELSHTHNAVCLMGNHEQMMLDFLQDPTGPAFQWLQFGGLQTLASFDVFPVGGVLKVDRFPDLAEALREKLGPELLAWLGQLPPLWHSGNVVVTHAALDPEKEIDEQDPLSLLWGNPAFGRKCRKDGTWVVHGHTVVSEPTVKDGVISIDTGAFATGKLSAAIIGRDRLEFLHP